MYDILIKNASVLDGTGTMPFVADIAVKNGKIARIADNLPDTDAAQIIDAAGLTVTPGWIDSHSHSDNTIITFPDQREKAEQGITFSITGQCGGSAAPSCGENGLESVKDFLDKTQLIPQGSGAALLIGHNSLRRAVMGNENRAPSPAELEQMKKLLREGLDSGAIGMSLGLFYVPGCYSHPDEVIALAKTTAEKGGVLVAHLRNEDFALLDAMQEFIDIIKASGARGVVSHHKAMWPENWGRVKTTIDMIEQANAAGTDIYMDVYPYCASNTTLLARFVPRQFHPEGTTHVLSLLDDPVVAPKIRKWAEVRWHNDLSWTMITSSPSHREYEGLNINEIADARGQTDRLETVFDLLWDDNGHTSASFFMMCEEDVSYVLRHPLAMICTDSEVAGDNTTYHPRLRAAFPRVLGRYVREQKLTSLPEMIRKMTSLPAHVYGLTQKGRIAEGMDADLCIFDAEKIMDHADFQHCSLPNEGLCYVIINGKIVVTDGQYNGLRAGCIYRKAPSHDKVQRQ